MEFITGSHTFSISHYSLTSKALTNKSYIKSDTFHVGNHDWVINYYPNGLDEASSDYISLYVELIRAKNQVKAVIDFRLKNWETNSWSTNTVSSHAVQIFNPNPDTHKRPIGFSRFIKRSDLAASSQYLKDDALMIKCTLWVMSDPLSSSTPAISLLWPPVAPTGHFDSVSNQVNNSSNTVQIIERPDGAQENEICQISQSTLIMESIGTFNESLCMESIGTFN